MTQLAHRSEPPALDVARLVRRAVADAAGTDGDLLDGYLETLAEVAVSGRRLARHELGYRRAAGITAAERNISLAAVVDLHLSATWLSWRHLPKRAGDEDDRVTAVLRAANDAIVALADGYQNAQRTAIRHEAAMRRELVDDLLHGGSDPTELPERAARLGLQLAARHAVLVARSAAPFNDGDDPGREIDRRLRARDDGPVLITTKEGRLVCVVPAGDTAVQAVVDAVRGVEPRCRIGIGRPYAGPLGVARSYGEARDVLHTAERLGLDAPVLKAADLLVFQVLFRDRPAISDLVATVLGPLQEARGGARPLVDTLAAYFATGSATAAARQLQVGARTVTYRLARIRELTGYHPTDPGYRLTLEAAVLGARLLHWPDEPVARHRPRVPGRRPAPARAGGGTRPGQALRGELRRREQR
ncbi:MAG TPA: helix-turn-helix domain-containing protein [Actinoplanes sp.]|nr:helix-turn-helix domain-containing protein [Actinoplanes sp.]